MYTRRKAFLTATLSAAVIGSTALYGGGPPSTAPSPDAKTEGMLRPCREVMGEVLTMQNEMTSLDQELQELVSAMQAAPDDKRMEAMEAAIEKMAAQRREILAALKGTHQKMIGHLFVHLVVEEPPLAACPIMKYLEVEERGSGTAAVPESLDY